MGRKKAKSKKIQLKEYLPVTECLDLDTIAHTISVTRQKNSAPPPAQASVLMNVHYRWKATMYWCAYFLKPDIDISRSPYKQGSLTKAREWAEFCYEFKNLTRFCWENDPALRNKFQTIKSMTPWKLWISVLGDLQHRDYQEAASYSSKGKTEHQLFFTNFLKALRNGDAHYTRDALALNVVLTSAQRLRKRATRKSLKPAHKNEEFFEMWGPTLRKLNTYAHSLSKKSFCTISQDGYRVENRSHGNAVITLKRCDYEEVDSLADLIQGDDWDQVFFKVGMVDGRELVANFSVHKSERWKNTCVFAKDIGKTMKDS